MRDNLIIKSLIVVSVPLALITACLLLFALDASGRPFCRNIPWLLPWIKGSFGLLVILIFGLIAALFALMKRFAIVTSFALAACLIIAARLVISWDYNAAQFWCEKLHMTFDADKKVEYFTNEYR